MKTMIFSLLIFLLGSSAAFAQLLDEKHIVKLPVETDPTVSFRIFFNIGSQNDPKGKEGLASLTASIMTGGATTQHSYEEILDRLYPMASSISSQIDKEVTVIYGRTHKDNLDDYYALLKAVILSPAFMEADFQREKTNILNYIQKSLRYSQDEELGKETLYEYIFEGTPYAHNEEGHVAGLNSITLDDVKAFYKANFTQSNLTIGIGGGFDDELVEKIRKDFNVLPQGKSSNVDVAKPAAINGFEVKIVEKDANATAISFGFPIDVVRGSREFYALAIATSWLGEHRNSSSHLYQVIREKRGLNYGDYAYIEHFPLGYRRSFPPSNVPRRQQIFQIWIRPVPNEARVFAFRAALRELQMLVDHGMTKETFKLTKNFLKNYTLHYAPTTSARLGYALDDHFYGIEGDHWQIFRSLLDEITLEEVNAALKKHFQYKNVRTVFITSDAAALKDALVNNSPSPIEYESEKPADVLEEDKKISTYPLTVKPENVTIVPVDVLFEGETGS